MENICSSFSEQWQKWPGKGAGWECRVRYAERHFLPLSPLLRGIVNGASDLQPVLQEQRSPKKIPSQECLQGAGAVLCGAEFTRGGEELSSQVPVLGKCVCPKIKAFWKVGCIYAALVGRVSEGCGESQLVGAAGRDQGELRGALVPWRSHAKVMS